MCFFFVFFFFFTKSVHSWHNDAYDVQITKTVPDQCYDLGVKGLGHIKLKSVYDSQWEFLFHFFDRGNSFKAK